MADTMTREDYERQETFRPERTGQPAQPANAIFPGPVMRFDPSGASQPMKEYIPWKDRIGALAQWAGLALPGRGGVIYGWAPFGKAAQGQVEATRALASREGLLRGDTRAFDPVTSTLEQVKLPRGRYDVRQAIQEAQAQGDTGLRYDFRQSQPVFGEPQPFKYQSGGIGQPQPRNIVSVTYDVPGIGPVKVGDITYTSTPGAQTARISNASREPNVRMTPGEIAHTQRAFRDWLANSQDLILDPSRLTAGDTLNRLYRMGNR